MVRYQLSPVHVQLGSDRSVKMVLAGLALLALALLSSYRAPVWESDATLWAESLRQMPWNPRALINAHRDAIRRQDIAEHDRICGRLMDQAASGWLSAEEKWFTDQLCLSR